MNVCREEHNKARLYLNDVVKRWPNNVIPYVLSCSFSEDDRGHIAISFDEIEKASCIKFKPATTADPDWVEIVKDQSGCFADLGYLGPNHGKHTCNIEGLPDGVTSGPTCILKSVIIHELFHNFGVSHEQTRPDRDNYMTVNWPKMTVIMTGH